MTRTGAASWRRRARHRSTAASHSSNRSVSLAFNGTTVFAAGSPVGATLSLDGPLLAVELDIGLGDGAASYLASDLTYDYVRINAEYTS